MRAVTEPEVGVAPADVDWVRRGKVAGSRLAAARETRTTSPAGTVTSPRGTGSMTNRRVGWWTGPSKRRSSSTAGPTSDGSARTLAS